jgi:anti-sigma B factor antagonist
MASDDFLSVERREGKSSGVAIIRVTGPLTMRNLFVFQDELRSRTPPATTILDFLGVPYLDSAGMGAVINHYVHCQKRGCKLLVAGVNSRALELFLLTRVNTIIPMFANVEEAEGLA